MFKRVFKRVSEWVSARAFNRGFILQFLVTAFITAFLAGAVDLFVYGNINSLFPEESVYAHFNELSTQIIEKKNVDFLENSSTLDYYTVLTDSKAKTKTISLYGDYGETLTLVVSNDYNLISMDRLHDNGFIVFWKAIVTLLWYLFIGICAATFSSIVVWIAKYFYTCVKKFFNKIFEDIFKDEEYDEEDDDYDGENNDEDDHEEEREEHKKQTPKAPKFIKAPKVFGKLKKEKPVVVPAEEDFDEYDDFNIEDYEI